MVSPVWLWQADQGAIEELQKLSIGSLRKLGLRMKKSRFQLHLLIYNALRTLVTFWNCSIILICKFLVLAYTDSLLILIFHSTLIDASGSRNQSHSTTILSKMWTYLSKRHIFSCLNIVADQHLYLWVQFSQSKSVFSFLVFCFNVYIFTWLVGKWYVYYFKFCFILHNVPAVDSILAVSWSFECILGSRIFNVQSELAKTSKDHAGYAQSSNEGHCYTTNLIITFK